MVNTSKHIGANDMMEELDLSEPTSEALATGA